MSPRNLCVLFVCAAITAPTLARSDARLINVTALDGGCVAGPTGNGVQHWDVQPGKTYELTISQVTECAHDGTDATLDVRVKSSSVGNTDLVATYVSPGTYKFSFTLPAGSACTFPIQYCTTPGQMNTGTFVQRNDGEKFQAHLRAATFGPGCSNPTEINGGDCSTVPTRSSTWGKVKQFYR